MLYVLIAIVFIILLYIIITYNKLVGLKNIVKEAFSTMDIYLKKRWDLIPNLVEVVKAYASHEKSTFEEITNIRSKLYDSLKPNEKISINENLSNDLPRIIALAENYPELKANENFLDLSKQLVKIEDDIANSRKYYNGAVRKLNTTIQKFPNNIVANMFKIGIDDMFRTTDEERKNINVDL